jgi:urea transport system ATP-binding protein
MSEILTVTDLHGGYGRARVLFGVDLAIENGQTLCVLGRNGVGKTTMLNTVMGVLPASAGTVLFDGLDVTKVPVHQRVRLGMGYCPQGHETFPQLTVRENLKVTIEGSPRGSREAAYEALDLFPRLVPLIERRAGLLSGGQQQQLAIARALITQPRLLILDEPTEGIQPSIVDEICDAIQLLHSRGLSILLVEQYLDFAQRLADRVAVMEHGAITWSGGADELGDEAVRRMVAI